jgi:hypothetical protein
MSWEMSERAVTVIFALVFLGALANCIRTGTLPIRGGPTLERQKDPVMFWTVIVLLSAIDLALASSQFL